MYICDVFLFIERSKNLIKYVHMHRRINIAKVYL